MADHNDVQSKAINAIRFLSADAVQHANSGHPGLPMGAAAIAYTIWMKHLRHNPADPEWMDRDRFILSGGHGSMLLYSLLYLTGYDLSLEELEDFRQLGSRTPGHPEYGITPGVEVTTGPLGQGFANGVGMAIAEAHLAAEFNKPDLKIVDHYVYAIVTDGDLMEGIASEAASFAGHLELGKLVYLYDDNRISIDGSTDLTFTEDRAKRFEAYDWHVVRDIDGNDIDAIDSAIEQAKEVARPSLIICRTQIGYGLPTRQGTAKAHGEPPGIEELSSAKVRLNWPEKPMFYVPEEVLAHFREAVQRGAYLQKEWQSRFDRYQESDPVRAAEFKRRAANELPDNWDASIPDFPVDDRGIATRVSSGKVLNILADRIPELIGGSADLAPSNKTWIDSSPSFQVDTPQGRNFHFGVREHAMGGIVNGMAVHGGVIPYAGTFLVFSDYMRPAIRLSALSEYPSIWIFTHDSIGLGEDGPTHQPIEHLAALRAIPDLFVVRPSDANEVIESWKVAIRNRAGPTALILSRQNLPTLDRKRYSSAALLEKGAYILADLGGKEPDIILMASGSEVHLILQAAEMLARDKICVRAVSFPSWELFTLQPDEYRHAVFPEHMEKRIAVEAGVSLGWHQWIGDQGVIISVERFGISAPYEEIYNRYGLTSARIYETAKEMLKV